jgi:hypothetical protein
LHLLRQPSTLIEWRKKPNDRDSLRIDPRWFFACLVFILGVSIYDTYLVVLYRDSILVDERNPICELLIRQDPRQLSWFLLGKTLGNLGVMATLMALYWFRYPWAISVAASVAMFQFWLLVFLNFSDPLTGFLYFDGLLSHDPKQFAEGVSSASTHGLVTLGFLMVGILMRIWWKSLRNSTRALGTA